MNKKCIKKGHCTCSQSDTKNICIWKYNIYYDGYYNTKCGNAFCFNYSKREKEFKYCPYCGRRIKEIDGKNKVKIT